MLLNTYPRLCSNNAELFTTFLKFLQSSRRPAWNSPHFLEIVETFVKAYNVDRSHQRYICKEVEVNMGSAEVSCGINLLEIFPASNPFDFPVITSSASATISPLELPESLINLCESCAPIIAMSLSEDRAGSFLLPTTSLLSLLGKATTSLPNAFLAVDFIPRMRKIWAPVKKVAALRKSEKVVEASRWLTAF